MAKIRFAVVVGSDVAATIALEENSQAEHSDNLIAAYRSNPIVIETDNLEVAQGWTWDGVQFNPPVGA